MATLRFKKPEIVGDGVAWLALLSCVLGAFAATGTFIGTFIGKTVHHLPIWIVVPAALIGIARVLYDLLDDGIPNRLSTIYIATLWPSWLLGAQGKGSKYVNGWIHDLNGKIDDKVGPWVSDNPNHTSTHALMTVFAITFIGFGLYSAHRYYSGQRANRAANRTAGATTTSTSTGTNTPIIASRKRR